MFRFWWVGGFEEAALFQISVKRTRQSRSLQHLAETLLLQRDKLRVTSRAKALFSVHINLCKVNRGLLIAQQYDCDQTVTQELYF